MAESLSQLGAKRRFYASARPQRTPYSPYLHTTPSHPTFSPPSDNYHSGTREGRRSIDRGLKPEGTQPSMKTWASSTPEPPRQCNLRRVNAVDVPERSTDSLSKIDSSTWSDASAAGKPTSDIYRSPPATGSPQVRPETKQHGTQTPTYNPLFGIPKDGQIREVGSVSRNYGENTRTADSGHAQIPVDHEQAEESPFGTLSFNSDEETLSRNAQTFQQSVLVAVRDICTDAARHYWQTKRPRPHLVVDIPCSRGIRRSAPYPERQLSDIPPTRHFHDPRRILHWTMDGGEQRLVYQDSFEELIWRISEQEWTQATERSKDWSGAGTHMERLTAVRRMNRLYDWAHTVIQAFEMVHDDQNLLSPTEMTDVMLAARDLAVWLLADDEKNEIQKMWAHVIQLEQ